MQQGHDRVIRISYYKKRSKQFNWYKHWRWGTILSMLIYSSGNGLLTPIQTYVLL